MSLALLKKHSIHKENDIEYKKAKLESSRARKKTKIKIIQVHPHISLASPGWI